MPSRVRIALLTLALVTAVPLTWAPAHAQTLLGSTRPQTSPMLWVRKKPGLTVFDVGVIAERACSETTSTDECVKCASAYCDGQIALKGVKSKVIWFSRYQAGVCRDVAADSCSIRLDEK